MNYRFTGTQEDDNALELEWEVEADAYLHAAMVAYDGCPEHHNEFFETEDVRLQVFSESEPEPRIIADRSDVTRLDWLFLLRDDSDNAVQVTPGDIVQLFATNRNGREVAGVVLGSIFSGMEYVFPTFRDFSARPFHQKLDVGYHVEVETECPSCHGTGVYKSVFEHGRTGVVCRTCEGSGLHIVKYRPFQGRQRRADVQRVYPRSGHVVDDHIEGGVEYEAFFNNESAPNVVGNELRGVMCPAGRWKDEPGFQKIALWKTCEAHVQWGGRFSLCPCFPNKQACWELFDKQYEVMTSELRERRDACDQKH